MDNYMMNRSSIIKDCRDRVVSPGDLLRRVGVFSGTSSCNSGYYKVMFFSTDSRIVTLRDIDDPMDPLLIVSVDALRTMYEVAVCNACGHKLAIMPLEITPLDDEIRFVDAPEWQRCNKCKFKRLAKYPAYLAQGGETP